MAQRVVLRHGKIWDQVGMLVNHRNAEVTSLERRSKPDRFAIKQDAACIGLNCSREDLNQGGFSRPIFSDQGMHFTCAHGQVYAIERNNARVVSSKSAGLNHKIMRQYADSRIRQTWRPRHYVFIFHQHAKVGFRLPLQDCRMQTIKRLKTGNDQF